ncbi:Crp/Fnr family transcriptional regulator [Kaistia dalseonensis]|uniref:CRP-like cAMP-binding protein n=1 Tax=Kaistia dalseonensis TaxID=410840 RepID=A0ABU0H829_9HYPH|nr:Crp/Fnr family transcriptional regulator [Kaistia dalseonensis]MCX5495834.1 Crp/Fnr family transcriptional regulator [Kaistia dalseonensis]MDQ0438435.1 CRP-like cAMP-binding protein [Kaistia dalseonensis]
MDAAIRQDVQNRLLSLMIDEDFARITPALEAVDLPFGFGLAEADAPAPYVYFPNSGIGSIITTSPTGESAEAGLFGRDGASPIHPLLGAAAGPQKVVMQVAGHGLRIRAGALRTAIADSPGLRDLLLRYVQTLVIQTAFTALSNAAHKVDQRLARWLLMCHDRVDGNEIALTHDYMSVMLAVRRPTVTLVLHELEGRRLIRSTRGKVTILDRPALEAFAANAYGTPEREYRRLVTGAI